VNGVRLKTERSFTDSALKVVIFLPYLQMSKNHRRDFARGERRILGSRTAGNLFRMDRLIRLGGQLEKLVGDLSALW